MPVVDRKISVSARAAVRTEGVAANLRARVRIFRAFINIGAQMLILWIRFETSIALALVANWFVDADVSTRVDGHAFINI